MPLVVAVFVPLDHQRHIGGRNIAAQRQGKKPGNDVAGGEIHWNRRLIIPCHSFDCNFQRPFDICFDMKDQLFIHRIDDLGPVVV